MSFINKFRNFMYGRYGIDELYGFLLKLYIILVIIGLFVYSKFLLLLELLIIFIMFYRVFSKKTYKRSKENQKYLKLKNNFMKPFHNIKRNINDKEHIYKRCTRCKKTLKLPLPFERGIKHTKCPNCKKRLTIFTLKKQKIEIIKKKV